ncbi:MAG: hypothetical protein ACM3O9_01560 [Methylocystaceae bacterium]
MQMSEYQALMEGLFPSREDYCANSMHPVVIGGNDGEVSRVYFLILADDYLNDPFANNPADEVSVAVNTLGVANENGLNKDLRFRVEFMYPEIEPSFVSVIAGTNSELERFLQAIAQVTELTFFITDVNLSLVSVVRIPWDYKRHESVFSDIRDANEKALQV